MSSHIRFNDSDAEEYQPSDSEDDLNERDKNLLKKARNKGRKYSDSEEEVFDVNASDASSESDIALSDVEGQGGDDDEGIPSAKAWGKNKRSYYSTDYIDADYGGFQGKDGAMAELEEEEAKKLQTELAKTMDDDDFVLDFQTKDVEKSEPQENVIKTDVSKLSKRQRLQLLKKESPEFFGLVEDYEAKMLLIQDTIHPVIRLYKEGKVAESKAVEFVQHYYELILNYTTNIVMYLLIKSKGINVQKHPIIKRLYQYRQLISQMDPVFEEVIKAQIEIVIDEASQKEKSQDLAKNKKKTLKLLSKLSKKEEQVADLPEKPQKRKREDSLNNENAQNPKAPANESSDDESAEEIMEETTGNNEEEVEETPGGEESAKRGITYQIAKNKGLTPYRKKELRNPRVKHRNKFRKAKIRRKGAVREVRTELSRYGGEISGIKTSVTKSIKIKT